MPAVWAYHADILNNGVTAGAHTYSVRPGAGLCLEIVDGTIFNGDAAGIAITARIHDGTSTRIMGGGIPEAQTLGAGARMGLTFTTASLNVPSPLGRIVVPGGLRFEIVTGSVAVSQDTAFGFIGLVQGGIPTVTLTGPAGSTATVRVNDVFAPYFER